MKKVEILGKDGLTITSANHLANISKEMYEAIESRLESLKFYNRDYMLAVNGNTFRVENESEKSELDSISEDLRRIGALKSFIAYLREAIKAKADLEKPKSLLQHIHELADEGRTELKAPKDKEDVTFEEELSKLSPERRARYYSLEAKCAAIGAYIHPDGPFAQARKAYFEHKKNPTMVNGRGQEAEISTFSSSFTSDEVDAQFFALQKEYRSLQAEFNSMKAEIEQRVNEVNRAIADENNARQKFVMNAMRLETQKYFEEVKALKVVIPQNLRDIYEEVNAVANAK